MRASCSSIVTDDFDDFNEKNLYPSSSSSNNCISLINDIQNNDFPFFDDLNDEICKRSDSHYEQDLSQNSSQKTLHYDPQLANLIENELGLNDCQTSRKNAWGNLSYAELIAKAIQNSDQQRLTLSQIYSWMILYIPYFRDKADKKSSTGWKNSIRHNLSLHNCFVRIPNEIAGKSSWWTIDHRAKQVRGRKRLQSNENSTKSSKTTTTNYLNKSNSTCSNLTNNQQSTTTTFTSVRDINKSFYHHLSTQTMPNILHDMLKSSSPLQTSNYSNSVDNIYSLNPTKCELIDNEYYSLNNVNEYEMISSKLSKQLKTIDHSNPLFRRMVLTIMRHQMNKSKLNNNNNNNNEREKILSTPPPSIIENSQCNFNSSSSSTTTTTTTTTSFDFDFETIYDLDKTTFEDSQFNIHDLSHF